MGPNYIVSEKDDAGRQRRCVVGDRKIQPISDFSGNTSRRHRFFRLLPVRTSNVYKRLATSNEASYQVLNALQAFCNSLASLISSRAVLEGFGVGDPSATATHALLLTVVQDFFSRITTIFGAYAFGSSLVPEAKTYRFLADVLNDAAVILDTFSPALSSPSFPVKIPGLRISALCLSASFRALCGIAAGGSKAAITLHFATPVNGNGDVGDLNAKDSSKETVLALFGMLLGTFIVPKLTSPATIYSALFILVGLHLLINYLGVRGLELRSLNRQRAGIAWRAYRLSSGVKVPSPAEVSRAENILGRPDVFRDDSGRIIGRCTIGSSFADVFHDHFPAPLLDIFKHERYLLWYDHQCLYRIPGREGQHVHSAALHLHILLKDGYSAHDQLKAWIHASDLCQAVSSASSNKEPDDKSDDALSLIQRTLQGSTQGFPDFIENLRGAGWSVEDVALMPGSPKAVLTGVEQTEEVVEESRKIR
ncbi:hypothetical protein H0H81_010983 [Sphagnurus paluster]|uniref:DUF647-domain-containing protein n=1 Tax=Sphagnurus paluster TaxID=117069 RepID=A0A9P7KKK0_9AGAR|nr:hypothetical protein H0H81_010983 [Sphagnurus paluster]